MILQTHTAFPLTNYWSIDNPFCLLSSYPSLFSSNPNIISNLQPLTEAFTCGNEPPPPSEPNYNATFTRERPHLKLIFTKPISCFLLHFQRETHFKNKKEINLSFHPHGPLPPSTVAYIIIVRTQPTSHQLVLVVTFSCLPISSMASIPSCLWLPPSRCNQHQPPNQD